VGGLRHVQANIKYRQHTSQGHVYHRVNAFTHITDKHSELLYMATSCNICLSEYEIKKRQLANGLLSVEFLSYIIFLFSLMK